jgi:polyisoprenoid-binding protein YceI
MTANNLARRRVGNAGLPFLTVSPMFKSLFLIMFSLVLASPDPTLARTADYRLDPARSDVAFIWSFGPDEVQGHMQVARAALVIDFTDVTRSKVDVAIDAAGAEAGFPFASQAMKGPKVLDTRAHPLITFISTKVTKTGDTARIDGLITIRGVTKPITLTAKLFRPQGSDASDLTNLSIRLGGTISRAEFGADGWPDMVGDAVRLDILAHISEVN